MRFPKTFPVLMVICLGLAFAACGDDDSSDSGDAGGETAATTAPESTAGEPEPSGNAPAPSGDAVRAAKVEIVEFTYEPDPVTVEAGGKVIWTNRDSAPHTATADDGSFDTGTLEEGKLKSESFKEPGTYSYFCEIHPTMKGTVEVVAAG
jgi:plastocyanin